MLVYQFLFKYGSFLLKNCLKAITGMHLRYNSLILSISRNEIQFLCNFLKNHTNAQYKILIDIVVVDYPLKKKRFEVIYNLLSVSRNSRLFLKCQLTTLDPIYSITGIYAAAAWFEREA
jgi:NADH:ubiquinone oxidoreductase subunit C